MAHKDKVVIRFDWDRVRERILDASISALERLTDKVELLSERADQAIRAGASDADLKAEDERLVRETSKLLISTIGQWREACLEKNKARGLTGEYNFDINAAKAEIERRLAHLAKSAARRETAG